LLLLLLAKQTPNDPLDALRFLLLRFVIVVIAGDGRPSIKFAVSRQNIPEYRMSTVRYHQFSNFSFDQDMRFNGEEVFNTYTYLVHNH